MTYAAGRVASRRKLSLFREKLKRLDDLDATVRADKATMKDFVDQANSYPNSR